MRDKRPTIQDLAEAADVSPATVNRILAGGDGVRKVTMDKVAEAARRIGFYGLGAIESHAAKKEKFTLGFLLMQPHRQFYQRIANTLKEVAAQDPNHNIDLQIRFMEDLSPHVMAAQMLELGNRCQSVAVVAPVHPHILQAAESLNARNIPVFSLIAPLSNTGDIHYIGIDNWKVGRTAAWFFDQILARPAKIGVLVGNYRYRNQEMNESAFRAYFREHGDSVEILEAQSTFESAAVASEITENLLIKHPDLSGMFISGGGITGVFDAVKNAGQAGKIKIVGYDLFTATREALLDGTMTMSICNPLMEIAQNLINNMIKSTRSRSQNDNLSQIIPFDIVTVENL